MSVFIPAVQDTYWLNNSSEQRRVAPKPAVGSGEEKGSFTAPIVINRTLLITHWGIKYSTDNRPRLSWRAPAMQRCWLWSWPRNSCSGLKHLSPQWAKQTQPILPSIGCGLALDLPYPRLCTSQWHHQSASLWRSIQDIHLFFLSRNGGLRVFAGFPVVCFITLKLLSLSWKRFSLH